jgi:hypothetical protein
LQEVKEVAGASYRVNWNIYCVSLPPLISLKEASKARVAAYKKAIEDAVKATAAAAAAAADTPAEPSELIELDSDDKNNSDDNTYATFEDKGDFVLD